MIEFGIKLSKPANSSAFSMQEKYCKILFLHFFVVKELQNYKAELQAKT